ncbi:MAG TPA: excinuclease ABC subunit UvrC, partial [Gemmatimonadetes bacterium]|nr:excinuclease ABC subunit UvrC [Gemmatimonadota bacterium]
RPIPDFLVVDGGKGQLGAARGALQELGVTDVALAALAKREELVFRPDRPDPIRLGRKNPALHLLQRLRDEAHRFAVSYNRKLRSKRTLRSDLSQVPGIGPERQKMLLSRFGSVRGVKAATPQEIARLPGISDTLAVRILTYVGS